MRLVLKLGSIASRTIFNDCCPQQLTGAAGTAACVTRVGCTTKHIPQRSKPSCASAPCCKVLGIGLLAEQLFGKLPAPPV